MDKFKNKVAVCGPILLQKAFRDELLANGYKWNSVLKSDFKVEGHLVNNYIENNGLGNAQIMGLKDYQKYTLPEQYAEALAAALEVVEPKIKALPKNYIVSCANTYKCGDILKHYYGADAPHVTSDWNFAICDQYFIHANKAGTFHDSVIPVFQHLPIIPYKEWVKRLGITPVITKMKFASRIFSIDVNKGTATCAEGVITKAQIKKVLDWYDTDIHILGFAARVSETITFGCQTGTIDEIRAIYAFFE